MTAPASPPDLALKEAFAEWKKTVSAELNGVPFEKKLVTKTFEEIALQPLYIRTDTSELPALGALPGRPPFHRGTGRATTGRGWQIAQEIDLSQLTEYNRALLASLQRGQDAVVLRADRASRGISAGTEQAEGLPLSHLHSFSTALAEVDLRAVSVHLAAGADPRALAALYLGFVQDRGIPFAEITGSVTSDPLGDAATTGRFPGDLGESYDAMAEWTRWAAENTPALQTISVDLAAWGDAGATTVQELAIALGAGSAYVRAHLTRGLPLDVVAKRIRFNFSVGPQFFTEIAKFRAFRALWTRVLLAFGGGADLGATTTFSARTTRWNKTLLDPHVNLLRTTTEALSAVLGGCDGLSIAPFDQVTGKTNDFSRRIALNVHTLLAEEFGFAQPGDPAGGSWYVEKLTDELARAGWTQFQDIERRSGWAACLRTGYAHAWVEKAHAAKISAVASRRLPLVGTNLFPNLKDTPPPPKPASAVATGTTHTGDTRAPKSGETPSAKSEGKFVWSFPAAIKAALEGHSGEELSRSLRPSMEEVAIPALDLTRAAEGFEELRRIAGEFASKNGSRPKVFLAKMGSAAQHKARADFSAAFFAVGGFEAVASSPFEDSAVAAAAASKSGAQIAVLCSTDETYPALAPVFAQTVKATHPRTLVVLAGLPADPGTVAAFRAAGFDEFIHARANAQEMLASFLQKIGAAL